VCVCVCVCVLGGGEALQQLWHVPFLKLMYKFTTKCRVKWRHNCQYWLHLTQESKKCKQMCYYVQVTSKNGWSEGMLSWNSQSFTTCSYITEPITFGQCLHYYLHYSTNPSLTLSMHFLACSVKHALEVWWFLLKFSVYDQQYFVHNGHELCSLSRPTMEGGGGNRLTNQAASLARNSPAPLLDMTRLVNKWFLALIQFQFLATYAAAPSCWDRVSSLDL